METQTNFETIGIGTKEAKRLEPTTVKIVKATVESVGEKNSKKVVCDVKHPESEDSIQISSVKLERSGKLEVTGLWFNQDEDGLIRKGSALALFLSNLGCATIAELTDKSCMTLKDDNGYLVFKGY